MPDNKTLNSTTPEEISNQWKSLLGKGAAHDNAAPTAAQVAAEKTEKNTPSSVYKEVLNRGRKK